jgi:hypothetical protein
MWNTSDGLTLNILSDSIRPHAPIPTHARTPHRNCNKLAEGKQTNRELIGQVDFGQLVRLNFLQRRCYMKELMEIVTWAVIGVFTYVLFVWTWNLIDLLWRF